MLVYRWLFNKRWRKLFLDDSPLATRLVLLSTILVIVPIFFVGTISYYKASEELSNEVRVYNMKIIEQVEMNIDYYMRDLEINTLKILNSSDVNKLLMMDSVEEIVESGIRKNIEEDLMGVVYSRPDVTAINLILDNKQIYTSMGKNIFYPLEPLINEEWVLTMPQNSSPRLVIRTINDWTQKPIKVITLARRIYSPKTLEPVGLLLLDVNFRRFSELAESVSHKNSTFAIIDNLGKFIYHPDINLLEKEATIKIDKLKPGGFWLDKNSYVTYLYSNSLDWSFVVTTPRQELMKSVNHIGNTIALTIIITLIFAYFMVWAVTASIVRPIKKLEQAMQAVENGNLKARAHIESKNEIGDLARGFNKMVINLKELINEIGIRRLNETEARLSQREMELKVLQAQINPHFLCNTLETIRGMALVNNNQQIASITADLGQLLRFNLRTSLHIVSVREEIKYCLVYLKIQKHRFDNKFDYIFDIPEWAWELDIPRFSLQPLIENSFVHAYGPDKQHIQIKISAQKTEHEFQIIVIDNGIGINGETLQKMLDGINKKDVTQGGKSIGLLNVNRRIVRLYGEEYGLTIESSIGKGTKIVLRLPLDR